VLGAGAEQAIYPATRDDWEREKERFLSSHGSEGTDAEKQRLQELTYDEFLKNYYGAVDQEPEQLGASPRVGHVAIVSVGSSGAISVIEAQTSKESHAKPGVREIAYDAWLATYSKPKVWHGRLQGLANGQMQAIVDSALLQNGKPYSIMPSNLDDPSQFYCSKLVWWSVRAATGKTVDGNPNPRRWGWLTPGAVFRSKIIGKLHNPGAYECLG
jgi:cell wall-associated NlpC family hydrolase